MRNVIPFCPNPQHEISRSLFFCHFKKCIVNKTVENVCGYSVSRKLRSCNPGSYMVAIKEEIDKSGPIKLVLLQLLNDTELSIFGHRGNTFFGTRYIILRVSGTT